MNRPDCLGKGFNDVREMCEGNCDYIEECANSDGYSSASPDTAKKETTNLIGSGFNKFFIVNRKFLNYLSVEDQLALSKIVERLDNKVPKLKDRRYIVINMDEPYVEEVIEIMKRNGHWG